MLDNRRTTLFLIALCSVLLSQYSFAQEMRLWADRSGDFKIEAKFVSVEKDVVKLEQPNGQQLQIELKLLCDEDQKLIKTLQTAKESPFKPVTENPFQPVEKMPTEQAAAGTQTNSPRHLTVDLSTVARIPLESENESWEFSGGGEETFAFKPRSIVLPKKRDFFEKLSGMAISQESGRVLLGYGLKRPGRGEATLRLQLCDLSSGKILKNAEAKGEYKPLALADDGERVLMCRNEFGFGKSDRLEIWNIQNGEIVKDLIWTPYNDAKGADRDVIWASFVANDQLITVSRQGVVVLWNSSMTKPLCQFNIAAGAVPALSADRKILAVCTAKALALFDIASQKFTAMTSTPEKLQWPALAFSPSGKRIACVAHSQILAWNATTGELEKQFTTPGISIHGDIDFPDDNFVLANNQYLIDLENQLKVWHYQGAASVESVGDTTLCVSISHRDPGALVPVKIPHAAAKDLLQKALTQPDLFVFSSGSTVSLDVSRIPEESRDRVTNTLSAKMKEMGCRIEPHADVQVVATITGPKKKEVSYHFGGDYQVNEYITKIEFVYDAKVIWKIQGSNVPGFIFLKRGENIEGVLRDKGRAPNYKFFEGVVLPKFLQKPTASSSSNSLQTLGSSRVTINGVE